MLVLGREQHSILTWKHKLVAGVIICMLMRNTKAPVLWNDPDSQNSKITV